MTNILCPTIQSGILHFSCKISGFLSKFQAFYLAFFTVYAAWCHDKYPNLTYHYGHYNLNPITPHAHSWYFVFLFSYRKRDTVTRTGQIHWSNFNFRVARALSSDLCRIVEYWLVKGYTWMANRLGYFGVRPVCRKSYSYSLTRAECLLCLS